MFSCDNVTSENLLQYMYISCMRQRTQDFVSKGEFITDETADSWVLLYTTPRLLLPFFYP